jgi:hypothetical protein
MLINIWHCVECGYTGKTKHGLHIKFYKNEKGRQSTMDCPGEIEQWIAKRDAQPGQEIINEISEKVYWELWDKHHLSEYGVWEICTIVLKARQELIDGAST